MQNTDMRISDLPSPPSVLEAQGISKRFGGTQALKDVSISFRRGEVHAIVGENGAGKSTLVKILSGFHPSKGHDGTLAIDGLQIQVSNIHDAEEHGIFLVPQDIQVVPAMTVSENLFLNRERNHFGFLRSGQMLQEAASRLLEFGFDLDPSQPIADLTTGEQQLVVIARAMMRNVKVLALDEPTAALTDAEANVLFDHVSRLTGRGIAVIYISHRLDEIIRIAHRVTIMRDGKVVEGFELGENRSDVGRRIVRGMVGRDVQLTRRASLERGKCKLSVKDFSVPRTNSRGQQTQALESISFEVHEREVVGVFGSIGSGADDLANALFGMQPCSKNSELAIDGKPRRLRSAAESIAAGIGYLPGHRQRDAVFPQMSIGENISMLELGSLHRAGLIDVKRESALVAEYFERFRVKASTPEIAVRSLSGGNQQKVTLARVLSKDPGVLILHEPTQGVDIATKKDIYEVVDALARSGKAILVVSTDLEEILTLSDRIIVLRQGKCAAVYGQEATQQDLLASATGGD